MNTMAIGYVDKMVTDTGQLITRLHDPAKCKGRPCVLHNPSQHHMVLWPLNWNGICFERVCPHGQFHPDPDSMRYLASRVRETGSNDLRFYEAREDHLGVLGGGPGGCDGCCGKALDDIEP